MVAAPTSEEAERNAAELSAIALDCVNDELPSEWSRALNDSAAMIRQQAQEIARLRAALKEAQKPDELALHYGVNKELADALARAEAEIASRGEAFQKAINDACLDLRNVEAERDALRAALMHYATRDTGWEVAQDALDTLDAARQAAGKP